MDEVVSLQKVHSERQRLVGIIDIW